LHHNDGAVMPAAIGPSGRREGDYTLPGLIRGISHRNLILLMSLVVLTYPGGGPLQPVVTATALVGILWWGLALQPSYWFVLAGLRLASHVGAGWYLVDNHQYLLTYWCLAVGLCLLIGNREEVERLLRQNARLLLGLCFAIATIWKIQAGQYLDGTFFQYSLLAVERFDKVAALLGGSAERVAVNAETIAQLRAVPGPAEAVALEPHLPGVRWLAQGLAIWTIAVEAVIALAFLLPGPRGFRNVGHLAVLIFVSTTYFFAPVFVFASLLLVLGAASLEERSSSWRFPYLVIFTLLPVVLLSLVDLAFLGFITTGGILLVGYLKTQHRLLLWGGGFILGTGMGLLLGGTEWDPVFLSLGVGGILGILRVLEVAMRRETERLIRILGPAMLLASGTWAGITGRGDVAAVALVTLAATATGEWVARRRAT